jgi:hypothetical protein
MSSKHSWPRFWKYCLPSILFSIIFHLPSFIEKRCHCLNSATFYNNSSFFLKDNEGYSDSDTCKNEKEYLENYDFWYKDIARLIFTGILPFFIMGVLNVKIFLKIRSIRERHRMTAVSPTTDQLELDQARRSIMIMTVYFFFLLLFIGKKCFVLFCYKNRENHIPIECLTDPSLWIRLTKSSVCFVVDLTSSINFLIFIFTGSKFRIILAGYWKRLIQSCSCSKVRSGSKNITT